MADGGASNPDARSRGAEAPPGMKHICVYLGGQVGYEKRYIEEAETLGRLMAADGVGLVYGGARVGLMGVLANAVLSNGGFATGVVPRQLSYQELAHEELSRLYVVDTMHERKYKMQSLCHGCLALPGGYGTIEEMFEALTWAQKPLELHEKPCVFVNIDGYYDLLFEFLDRAAERGLLLERNRRLARQEPTAEAALRAIQAAWAAEEEALLRVLREYQQ
ncbi:MAG: TIGR00730 family Rossman fold protein [Acidobacteriota bacterium]|nr:TIGR00730 family Rossman fold protein [Acidobacteriota bacterium]